MIPDSRDTCAANRAEIISGELPWSMSSGESPWMNALQLGEAINSLKPANSQIASAKSQSHAKRTSSSK